jgi:hypothetical protein
LNPVVAFDDDSEAIENYIAAIKEENKNQQNQ